MNSKIVELRLLELESREDGYLFATKICQSCGKKFSDWLRLNSTTSFLLVLADKTGIPATKLVQVQKGGIPDKQGAWIHPSATEELIRWCNAFRVRQSEREVQARLHSELGGQIEVLTPAGAIDLLTSTELIEIKNVKRWKTAIGQLILFSVDYPSHQKRLHLFGDLSISMISTIERYCDKLGIKVTADSILVTYPFL